LNKKTEIDAKLKESINYLGRPAIITIANNQRLDVEEFLSDGKVIVKESIITKHQFNP
jgi:hypothetical protein